MSMSSLKIGDLADRTGVPPRMLRYYEQQGLLAPQREANGYRSYTSDDVARVRTVRSLVRAGLPTRLISVVLDMEDGSDPRWTDACTAEFASQLAAELASIEERLACLTTSRDTVRRFLESMTVSSR